jgi:hypothetical protein
MDLDNPAADFSGLGIPGDLIADSESFAHLILPNAHCAHWHYQVQQIAAHRQYFRGCKHASLGPPSLRFGVAVFARL